MLKQLVDLAQPAVFGSSVDTIFRFDVFKSQELLVNLAQIETTMADLVTEINTYAERRGAAPVKMRNDKLYS